MKRLFLILSLLGVLGWALYNYDLRHRFSPEITVRTNYPKWVWPEPNGWVSSVDGGIYNREPFWTVIVIYKDYVMRRRKPADQWWQVELVEPGGRERNLTPCPPEWAAERASWRVNGVPASVQIQEGLESQQ